MTQPLLVLGLDGYDPILGQQLMDEGVLSNLSRLMRRGAIIDLDHGEAKRTGLAWEHFATGLNPADADRYSAVQFDPATYECIQTGTRLRPFTDRLKRKTVVFDAPYFDLSRSPNTTGLVGWGAHDPGVANISRPSSLAGEVRKKFGDYPATQWIYGHTWPWPSLTSQSGEDLVAATHLRAKIATWMLTEKHTTWDMALIVVSELHSATEALWHGVDETHPLAGLPSAGNARKALVDVYRAVDDLVGELLNALPDAAVLAFNMHGMGANNADLPSMVLLPELMYRRNFSVPFMQPQTEQSMQAKQSGPVIPPAWDNWSDTLRRCFPDGNAEAHAGNGSVTRSVTNLVPSQARRMAKKLLAPLLPPRPLKMALNWMPALWYQPFWSQMDAFAFPAFYDGQIRINLVGRDAKGKVEPDAYLSKLDEIEALLEACCNPTTGQKAVRDTIRSHRQDPMSLGPTEADLIVVWDEVSDSIMHDDHGTIGPIPYRRPGGHTGGHGIAYFSGRELAPGRRLQRSAFDVAPTVLDWLDASDQVQVSGESFLSDILE